MSVCFSFCPDNPPKKNNLKKDVLAHIFRGISSSQQARYGGAEPSRASKCQETGGGGGDRERNRYQYNVQKVHSNDVLSPAPEASHLPK